MYIAWPTEYSGDRRVNYIILSNGNKYFPQEGKPPAYPRIEDIDKDFNLYLDYERMNAVYKLAVFCA